MSTQPLHVLVYGSVKRGVCDWYRFGMHVDPLREHGVIVRPLTTVRYSSGEGRGFLDAADDDDFTLDRSDIDWADVIVFRRFYQTVWSCSQCPHANGTRAELRAHARATGHTPQAPDPLVRPLLAAIERDPALLRGRAVVYETDDDLLDIKAWNGLRHRVAKERDLVERLITRADLVTTTTPVLASRLARWNDAVRVVRNAVDLRHYRVDRSALPPVEGDPRVLYYGAPVRYRDYTVAKAAVDAAKAAVPSLQRVWLGGRGAPHALERDPRVENASDEVLPYVAGTLPFARALAEARPDVGLAPLLGDEFDAAKSELHWLEYSAAGAATIATVTAAPGPFDVIRHGVDGLVARTPEEWAAGMLALATSRTLREELAGRAMERMEREYDVHVRAAEWADAYRWAAEHAGRTQRAVAVPGFDEDELVAEAREWIAYRARAREEADAAPARLEALRADAPVRSDGVSVVIPVADVPPVLVERAIASALAVVHRPLEVVVASTHARPRTGPATDPAVRWIHVPAPDAPRVPAEAGPETAAFAAEQAVRATLLAAASAAASSPWLVPLSPEGELDPDAVGTLVELATEHDLELVYGLSRVELGAGADATIGSWPPGPDSVLTLGTELFDARLLDIVPWDPDAWRAGESAGWSLWRRLAVAGARMANVELVVHRLRVLAAVA